MEPMPKQIVVIGGGVSGLSAAYYLRNHLQEQHIQAEITVVEKSSRFGGKIQTLHRDGFIIEQGADSFLARKMPIIDLTRELGLEDLLTTTNPEAKKTFILHRGRLHPMPPGLVLGIPTQWTPFLTTGLLSLPGKLRACLDLAIPARKSGGDESLGHFLERRLGREVLDNIVDPLLAGIYAGDTRKLSLMATFPQFREVERSKGSLIKGMIQSRKNNQPLPGLPDIARKSMFLTYKTGLSTLIDKLMESCEGVRFISDLGVQSLTKVADGYTVALEHGKIQADAVVLAVPAYTASSLLQDYVPEAEQLRRMAYVSVANIVMAFEGRELESLKFPMGIGSGFLVPRKENRSITACTWTSSKWLHTAPEDKALLRVYIGRSGQEEILRLSDGELIEKALSDLSGIMGLKAKPIFAEVTRLMSSMPQYEVGHLDRVGRIMKQTAQKMPGVALCGAGYYGVGIPDCVRQGKEAARQIAEHLSAGRN